jgi:hypothetical protein
LENITLQVYWDTQLKKRKNPYYSLRGSEVPLQSEQFAYFDFTNRDNDVIGGNIYQKNELCFEDYHMIIMESTF